jgi:hypothetical protein
MWTGRKAARHVPAQEAIRKSQLGRAALIVMVLGGALALLLRAAPDVGIVLF